MKPLEFVEILKREVIDGNLSYYEDLLQNTKDASDPIWKGFLPIFNSLNSIEKKHVLNFIQLVEVNTLSHVLGIIDGVLAVDEIDEEFTLTLEDSDEKLNGDLQDLFLALEE